MGSLDSPPRSFFDFLKARPSSASLRPRKGVPSPWDRTAGSSYTRSCGRSFFSRICWGGFFQYPSFRKASFPFTWRKPLCRAHRRTLARRKRETAFSCLSRSHLLSVCLKACPAKSLPASTDRPTFFSRPQASVPLISRGFREGGSENFLSEPLARWMQFTVVPRTSFETGCAHWGVAPSLAPGLPCRAEGCCAHLVP